MKTPELMDRLKNLGVTLTVEGDRLRYRPEKAITSELRAELVKHKDEVIACLGQPPRQAMPRVPSQQDIENALRELKPYLSPSLQKLDDDKLLALVNWNILVAWDQMRAGVKWA